MAPGMTAIQAKSGRHPHKGKSPHSTSVAQRFSAAAQPASGLPFSVGSSPIQAPRNDTGLPDHIKSQAEGLSGHSLDDVRVHYNSPKPAAIQAHAYTQGNQIHVAPGQERHVGHEAWHAVQQKQGRVAPTRQLKGITSLNDSPALEREADVMGARLNNANAPAPAQLMQKKAAGAPALQLKSMVRNTGQSFTHLGITKTKQTVTSKAGKTRKKDVFNLDPSKTQTTIVGKKMESWLDPAHPLTGTEAEANTSQENMMHSLKMEHTIPSSGLIKGHLLNANLGGLADGNNLFPISGVANKEHEAAVERKVKNLAWSEKRKTAGQGTYYAVNVKGPASHTSKANSFECTWGDWDIKAGIGNGNITNLAKYTVTSSYDKTVTPSKNEAQYSGIAKKPESARTKVPGYSAISTPAENETETFRTNDTHKKYNQHTDALNKSVTEDQEISHILNDVNRKISGLTSLIKLHNINIHFGELKSIDESVHFFDIVKKLHDLFSQDPIHGAPFLRK